MDFWQCLLSDPAGLAEAVRSYHPLAKSDFYELQKSRIRTSKCQRAATFFVLNRASFSGTTMSGGMSPGHPRFTESSIERLTEFRAPNLTVERADFTESIPKFPGTLLYLDPPYLLDHGLYGKQGDMQRNFDHATLSEMLHGRDGWILSYNDCGEVRTMYSGYRFCRPRWTYGMSADKRSREVLILSHDVAGRAG